MSDYDSDFSGKHVLVLGAGVSGRSVALILQSLGAEVVLSDAKPIDKIKGDVAELTSSGASLAFGPQDETLLTGMDYVVISPGISIYIPLIAAAKGRGIPVLSEVEVAYRLCPAPILAVTGTNGKTTTTTLLGEMMKKTGKHVVVGGNIGQALSKEVAGIDSEGIVVAEISSFQLEGIIKFRPHVAAVLNITPDHMDRHKTMDIYIEMKARIFANQTSEDVLVLNYDDNAVRAMAEKVASQVLFFSRRQELSEGIFVKNGWITVVWQGKSVVICPAGDLQLRGSHNLENALAACGVAFFAGVKPEDMAATLREFAGVEHRIEPVATLGGVGYYNDSKATNPESSIKALEAFDGHIILIAGGRDKNTDLTEFMKLIKERVDQLILLGEAAARFEAAARDFGVESIRRVADFKEAVTLAHSLAKPPQVVLLSPACSSYDMFNNYEERGRLFKELVKSIDK